MATGPSSHPSFSRGHKWNIGANVVFTVMVVLSVVVMVNYLAGHYFRRWYVNANAQTELSPRTLSLLTTMTNRVHITLYYDKDDIFYRDISDLLNAYRANCPNITVERVDYNRDPGKAEEVKNHYKLKSSTDKNLIIFDHNNRVQAVPGAMLPEYTREMNTNQPGLNFDYKLIAFRGEMMFTASLLGVINPEPLRAGYLQGHGEHQVDDTDGGYLKFASLLAQGNVQINSIKLLGTNTVPADCELLVIAGPTDPIPQVELDRIDQYLNEGGRLLVLFKLSTRDTGLEKLLARWGVQVGSSTIRDPDFTSSRHMQDVIVSDFSRHPVVNGLRDSGSRIQLWLPRPVSQLELSSPPEGLKVEEIARSGPRSYLENNDPTQKPRAWPLMAAVEKSAVKGATERGATRILVVGDSLFLRNLEIDFAANRDFADYAFKWLLDRSALPQGIGPRSVVEHRWLMSQAQQQALFWILLAAVPGGILFFGGLVWFRRRK